MTEQQQTRKATPEEDIRELYSRVAKLNDRMAAVLNPAWGAKTGILPEDHPLHPALQPTEFELREDQTPGALHELASAVRDLVSAIELERAEKPDPTPAPADDPLRQRIAEAVRTVPIKYGSASIEPVSVEEAAVIAAAVLAELQPELDQLRKAEAAIERVRSECTRLQAVSVLATGEPHTDRERGVVTAVVRILAALQPPAPAHDGGPTVAECREADLRWPLEKEGL